MASGSNGVESDQALLGEITSGLSHQEILCNKEGGLIHNALCSSRSTHLWVASILIVPLSLAQLWKGDFHFGEPEGNLLTKESCQVNFAAFGSRGEHYGGLFFISFAAVSAEPRILSQRAKLERAQVR